jgi:signal peptidase II
MIGGGAVGNNLLDRLIHGSVTDFLQFHFYFVPFEFPWKYYPAFNVADSAICTGVFLLIVTWYFFGKQDVPNAA